MDNFTLPILFDNSTAHFENSTLPVTTTHFENSTLPVTTTYFENSTLPVTTHFENFTTAAVTLTTAGENITRPEKLFCADSIWDTDLLLSSSWPQLTSCFQDTVLIYVPFSCLWLPLPFYLYMLASKRVSPLPISCLSIIKMFLAASLSLLSLITIIEDASNDTGAHPISISHYVANGIRVISYAVVAIVTQMERKYHTTTSGFLFLFWICLVCCDVVPLYTKIIIQEHEGSLLRFALFVLVYAMEVLQLLFNSVSDSTGEDSYLANSSPEVRASFPSRIFYWWVTRTVYNGWRKDLQEEDLFVLNPRDESDNLTPLFDKLWRNEWTRFKRKRKEEKSYDKLGYRLSDLSKSYERHGERSPLMANMNGKVTENGRYYKTVKMDSTSRNNTKQPKPSLLRVLAQMVGLKLCFGLVQKMVSDIFLMISPVLLSLLISYADHADVDFVWKGYAIAVLLFITQMIKSVLFNFSFWMSQIVGMQMKTTLIAAIYKKALTMNNESKKESTAGEIVNLMSVDCQRVQDVMNFFFYAWTTPFQVIIAIAVLYQYIGPSVFAGLAVLLLTIPFNSYVASKQQQLQVKNLKHKDSRLRLTNEALCGMKVLKLYAWEPPFHEKISDIRSEETKVLLHIAYLNVFISVIFSAAPYLVMLATFAVYVSVSDENHLDANKAFVALSFFNLLRVPLGLLSSIISMSVQAVVSIERINLFLCTGDLKTDNVIKDSRANFAIEVENGTFTWDKAAEPSLRNINLKIPDGKLYAVVGPVGSGKSSLVAALLGEMERLTGRASIKDNVAYVPQQAWIQNATVKDNILFGKPFDKKKYNKVISACALERDLEILSAGDMTEIGEKGINLSGGQKQRVSLARAVYSGANIFIFDDPLSAVDTHVGKHIFNNVVSHKGILKGKTRVLVTHGAHWLPMVDSIIVLYDGEIREAGSYEDLMSHNGPFAEFIRTYLLQGDDNPEDSDQEIQAIRTRIWNDVESATSDATSGDEGFTRSSRLARRRTLSVTNESTMTSSLLMRSQTFIYEEEDDKGDKNLGKLVQAEKLEKGKVKLDVFWTYSKATGTFAIALSFIFFALFQVANAWSNFWLTDWTGDPLLANSSLIHTEEYTSRNNYYLWIFGVFGIVQVGFLVAHNIIYWVRMVVAAKRLHFGMLTSIFRSPMSFFDTTPLGRIMNRFSRDIEVVDNNLPIIIRDYTSTLFICLVTLIIISISTPLFLTLVVPIMILYYLIQSFYVPTSRQLKRIESVTRSPIYTHFSETISGGATIRAYNAAERFIKESKTRVDRNMSFYYIGLAANRWLGMNLELLANIIILGSAIFAVVTPGISGGDVGLSVSYAIQVSSNLVWMVRQMSDLETNIVSVERLKEYSELESEAEWIVPHRRPVPGWPLDGKVKFSGYQTRYREGLDLVLKGITCEFKPGEKIGIVGRTGAGKSSLALALFRLIEATEGSISVDGIRISDIGLHDVRSRLTILPQDPVLFFGTLRMNLDPINEYNDHQLWDALTSAHLKDFVENLSEGLDYEVGEEGQSLSVGQRQLVCLARALLKKTKILILDEATAAVDMETDTLIQNTIRTEFSTCTIITIAHRLNTIMDYDRIMVLDAGIVKELDSPSALLANTDSIFYSMAKEANLV
ncbi:multidrug resistance-associated protein 1-like [Physella acuta]|uniref:ABC-type glutathione-S-conjugate transporter n=1 Tax=Physella acuta TaxID=109671 RepID=A0A346FQX0_PHYAT|nr:multidrug resistance-associated protein 1-like [Physella acuta]AXN72718.1 multidrug resistance protein 1 [Physella acuta]